MNIVFLDNVQYIAVGLSVDDRMGNDAGMECIPDGAGNIHAYSSWITARPNLGSTRQGVVGLRLKLISFMCEMRDSVVINKRNAQVLVYKSRYKFL